MAVLALAVLVNGYASAAKTVTFTSNISAGVLLADIRNQFGQSIANPTLDFGTITNSYNCRTGSTSLSAKLGSDSSRIYVDNPKAAYDGWTLTLSPKYGTTSAWSSSDSVDKFDYNDAGTNGTGCDDGDGDGVGGVLSVNSSNASLNSDCKQCTTNNVMIGSANEESFDSNSHITLLRANDQADFLGSWYMTGIDVKQTVPAEQGGGAYSIEMVLTATAS